ncbi:unnamed protein product [Trichogramma brassicae]|uniref:CRAL-TRIO domain-containing protein n=1 Tax=Trichogramma brassicae TaxID=86971 RepID=A0A6H5HY60_9HYME|nr:unnamed protein product [Trichogramma brassicae]
MCNWRKKHQIDKLARGSTRRRRSSRTTSRAAGTTSTGRAGPLYVLRLGQMDVKGCSSPSARTSCCCWRCHIMRGGPVAHGRGDQRLGPSGLAVDVLIDLEGLNMRHLWRPGIKALLRIIEIVEANYPETMGRVPHIARAPLLPDPLDDSSARSLRESVYVGALERGAGQFFNDFSFFFTRDADEKNPGTSSFSTAARTIRARSRRSQRQHRSRIHTRFSWRHFGGGVVPKNLYRADLEGTSAEHEHSLYHSVSLSRGQTHNVAIHCNDPGAVLTWDFGRHAQSGLVRRAAQGEVERLEQHPW